MYSGELIRFIAHPFLINRHQRRMTALLGRHEAITQLVIDRNVADLRGIHGRQLRDHYRKHPRKCDQYYGHGIT